MMPGRRFLSPMNPLFEINARAIIGHRGNSAHAPENTLESFRQAVELGADAIEFDVHVTADDVPVVMHDPMVDRTTDQTGPISALTWAQVARLDAGARFSKDGVSFPYRGRGISPPRLSDVLQALPTTPLMIEIKTPAASPAVKRVLEQQGAESRCVMASFVDRALDPFVGSAIPRASSMSEVRSLYWRALLRLAVADVPFRCVSIPRWFKQLPLPLGGYATILRPHGVPVHVWTVDDPGRARRLWRAGLSGIITNDPAVLLAARAGAASAPRPSPLAP